VCVRCARVCVRSVRACVCVCVCMCVLLVFYSSLSSFLSSSHHDRLGCAPLRRGGWPAYGDRVSRTGRAQLHAGVWDSLLFSISSLCISFVLLFWDPSLTHVCLKGRCARPGCLGQRERVPLRRAALEQHGTQGAFRCCFCAYFMRLVLLS
jgi:hypothetical protein